MVKLSVIVPVYNGAMYLTQCLESILNQSMQDMEVILVDDGSTDCSGSICDEYAKQDPRVSVFHQENIGPLEARRKGLLKSCGEYVTFVDSDDFIAPVSYSFAEKSMDKGIDVVSFGITRYYDTWDQRIECSNYPSGTYDKKKIEQIIWPSMIWDFKKNGFGLDPSLCTKIVKRELILSVYQRYSGGEIYYGDDSAIAFPLLKDAQSLEIREESFYYHRQREKNAVAGYFKDTRYLDKLYMVYCHLRTEFKSNSGLLKQIEYFYISSISYRKWKYEGRGYEQNREYYNSQFLFPFDKVRKSERIVIYGAGAVGRTYMDQLSQVDYCQVVLWVDKNYQKCHLDGVSPVEGICTAEYDKIVIAINNLSLQNMVADDLAALGVKRDQIVY